MNLIERRCGLTVLSLTGIALGIGLLLISLPSEGETAKDLSQADLRKIDDVTQTAVNAALARDFATWAAYFSTTPLSTRPTSRRSKAERRSALG
jgi:hypothetical protein